MIHSTKQDSGAQDINVAESGVPARSRRTRGYIVRRLQRNRLALAGLTVTGLFFLAALLAPWISPYDPTALSTAETFQPPSRAHLMGTDDLGMDVMSRVIWAARLDLYIAGLAMLGAMVIGSALGAVSGFLGGMADEGLMRFLDSQQAFPPLLLALAIATILGPESNKVILVIIMVNYPLYARLIRAQMLSIRRMEYAEAARSLGASDLRILVRHLIPNCLNPAYVLAPLNLGGAVLLSASLSFIGLGTQMPQAEWGLMIGRGARYALTGEWWIPVFPGFAIFFFVLGVNLLGDGVQDILDPKRR